MGPRPSRAARLLNPLGWSAADRALLIVAIMLLGVTLFVAMVRYGSGWPYFPPGADPAATRLLFRLGALMFVPWLILLGLGLLLRRRRPESRAFVHATIQAYAVTVGFFTYVTGPFYSPGWIAMLGGAIVGYLLFDRLPTTLGLVTFVVVVAGMALAADRGTLPYAPVLASLSRGDGRVSVGWLLRLGVCSLLFSAFTLALTAHIITRWRAREADFKVMSRTDELTGITNRRHFMELFERELARARRHQRLLSCVLVDLDHFKRINDTHGHLAGDAVLASVARTIETSLRDIDTVARWGGEEFIILLPDTDAAGAEEVAGRCLRRIQDQVVLHGEVALRVTASMGIASFPKEGVTRVEDLVHLADAALYRAKDAGRNQVVVAA